MAVAPSPTPTKVPSPNKLAHVVLRTNNIDGMVDWYVKFLGARVVHRNPEIAFITYDDEHHRMAFINIPNLPNKVRASSGLEHIAFAWDSLLDLMTAYQARVNQSNPVKPVWCVNHGPTVSLYYKDPDGNLLENQHDIMTPEEANAMIETPAFASNPFGVDFDPDELYEQVQRVGEKATVQKLRNRGDIGQRSMDSIPAAYIN